MVVHEMMRFRRRDSHRDDVEQCEERLQKTRSRSQRPTFMGFFFSFQVGERGDLCSLNLRQASFLPLLLDALSPLS